ncbi:AfsR/SARP family transcriptional regulator [Streptomyces kaniharaensis]|uniref:AfsR/SARP family transcriptional regulator n=1 Tax=Streptomyces kaniharaensis TaxID=212423 RepID=A0A6N7KKC2_9ACTN|nr:BTAD domain-containing putative transcriptional regulator [Streptomyces kaniharaensis]MQS11982.1 AfsR/SARP family transcriptional regulator [Streptomyces kaniharaensis]
MHYGILGTTTAHHDDGTPVPLGGARLRALLAALALRQGRPVPADLLVDEVWDTEPPQDSSAALQTLVGRLRRTIGRDEVGSGPAGYWLTGPATDVAEFRRLSTEGRHALDAGDHALAAERLRAALALWRGPALADLPDRSGPAARLEAQRDEARRHRITADLGLGRAAELVAELAELCDRRPLDEPWQYLMVRALHQSGRTAEALRHYERTRRALADELGVDPGLQLQSLHAELLAPEVAPAQAASEAPAKPAPPSPPQLPRAAGNLRGRLTSFVGRESDLAALRQTLTTSRLVTLTGPGGSGKTSLSVEAGRAEQSAAHWPDGVWVAELAPLESPDAVPAAVVSALGLREIVLRSGSMVAEVMEKRAEDPLRRLVEHCGHRRMLLVLDNCEHLIQAAADLAEVLLVECPGLTVLATSREPLGVPGETVLPVEPLPDPVALRLLAERAAAARPGFDPRSEPEACAEICRRLDGLPLAIELAAARLRVMTARQIADRLDSRFGLLTAGSRTLLPRQQTLRAVVDWSWDLLGKRERAVLRRLSVFAGGWRLEDAEAICADDAEVPREEVADLLLSLVDKSLLVADLGGGGLPRYRMLETIHEYAVERLAESTEAADTEGRHLAHFREVVATADLNIHGPQQLHWLAVLETEQDNVRAALRRAIDRRDEEQALVITLGMSWYWSLRGYSMEARGWYNAVAALGPDPFDPAGPAPAPLERNVLAYGLPMPEGVPEEARRLLAMYRLVGLFEGNLEVLGDPEAIAVSQQLVDVYTPDLPQSYRFPALMRVFGAFLAGRLELMKDMLDDAVRGCEVHGGPMDMAFILQIRAKMMNDWPGGAEQGIRDGERSLELCRQVGDLWGISQALAARGEALASRGEPEQAAAAYEQAIELALELGAPQEVPILRVNLGSALLELDLDRGERIIRETLDGLDATGANQAVTGALLFGHLTLCGIHAHRGEHRKALAELDRLDVSRVGGFAPGVVAGLLLTARGWITAQAGEPEQALTLMQDGRRLLRSMEAASGFAEQMTVMVVPAVVGVLRSFIERDGDPAKARLGARLLGAHNGLNGPKGGYLDRMERDRSAAALRAFLGDDEFEAAHSAGLGMTPRQTRDLLDELIG